MLQLFVVLALLILWPAWLFCKRIPARVWAAATIYSVFFGLGGLRRTLKFGKLSSRKLDAQVGTKQGRGAIAVFVLLVVAGQRTFLSFVYALASLRTHCCDNHVLSNRASVFSC